MVQLERLYLAETAVTDAGLAHLTALKKLKSLSLAKTRISAAGVRRIVHLPELDYLDLRGVPVGDEMLAALTGMKQLKDLVLYGKAIEATRRMTLQAALPACAIDWFDEADPAVLR